ncbi:hypothetical protein P8C59_006761 [Phyllachora maydis]|uniref:Uncharacterized protein n=1 Tax=Phyllachora maydis TaxID=1825666 RepID=A0AAD9MCV3_9PEZI|nr:hypothetical protein P8C59_006761 [Phyllachora maydis]
MRRSLRKARPSRGCYTEAMAIEREAGGDSASEFDADAAVELADADADAAMTGTDEDDNGDLEAPCRAAREKRTPADGSSGGKSHHQIPEFPLDPRYSARTYHGPLRRDSRHNALRRIMYGPDFKRIRLIWEVEMRFAAFATLPPRWALEDPHGVMPSPWVPDRFEADEAEAALRWYAALRAEMDRGRLQRSREVPAAEALLPRPPGPLALLTGPLGRQVETGLRPGTALSVVQSGLPVSEAGDVEEAAPNGWFLDLGGIPLAMAWTPTLATDTGDEVPLQLLAISAVPFEDQTWSTMKRKEEATDGTKDCESVGSIQFWSFQGKKTPGQVVAPSCALPTLKFVKSFGWGRPRRLQWCPVPLTPAGSYGLLAVLCGDGKARVLDIRLGSKTTGAVQHEWIESAITLGELNEYLSEVTCLSWVNANRIVLGHRDGCITLWSVHPRRLLQRIPVQSSYVLEVCSGYPSYPYLVASVPVSGCVTVTDLARPPSAEATYVPIQGFNFQPNTLCWCELLHGWVAAYPTTTTGLAFLHARFPSQPKSVFSGSHNLMSASTGSAHPYLLVGCADGSVWSASLVASLFRERKMPVWKQEVFENEYRPPADGGSTSTSTLRGAVRVLQGFVPETNIEPTRSVFKDYRLQAALERAGAPTKGKKRDRPREAFVDDSEASGGEAETAAADEGQRPVEFMDYLDARVVMHEPLTRVTVVAWNPNLDFSCWAAVAMGSGLVRVMDMGVE